MHATHTLHSLHTQSNADSVEFMPLTLNADDETGEQRATRTFVCGNYQLNEETRVKSGRIYLYQLEQQQQQEGDVQSSSSSSAAAAAGAAPVAAASVAAAPSTAPGWSLTEHQTLDTAAIFDLKWAPRLLSGRRILGQVDADGGLLLYEFTHAARGDASSRSALSLLHRTQAVDNASALSLDWNNRKHDCVDPLIAVSQSNSGISLWQLTSAGLSLTQRWVAHEYEMWIVSFDVHTPSLLYSGADDSKFKGWDLRTGAQSPRSSVFVDESHGAGVCTVVSHPSREFVVATGSYDESLRIWDVRSMRSPVLALEHALGGGVWRARWNPDPARADSILCAAMHNGFAVVDVDFNAGTATSSAAAGTEASAQSDSVRSVGDQLAGTSLSSADAPLTVSATTAATYKKHASLAYGADWCAATSVTSGAKDADLIATCSFYDKQLDVWQVDAQGGTAVEDAAATTTAAPAAAGADDSAATAATQA